MPRDFHTLTLAKVVPEIGGAATSLVFDIPAALSEAFSWTAGQHLTVKFEVDGKQERRSYTISSPPGDPLRITVKRVRDGKVSNHIGDHLKAGDLVEVMPPFGSFTLIPGATARRTHYFFGAGSGITPLFAMIKAMLADEPHSTAHLIYGNADAKTILFQEDLTALCDANPGRISVRHVLSSPSLWSWFSPWRSGRIDPATIEKAIKEAPPVAQDTQYWICGPGSMNDDVRTALMALDVPGNRIHTESFGAVTQVATEPAGAIAATAEIRMDGKTHEIPVEKGQTLLKAALEAGVELPYSCQSGVCGACKANLTEGRVHMSARMALEDDEIENGEILTCQSIAVTDRLHIRFSG